MLRNLKIHKRMWLCNAFLALTAAVAGLLHPGIYSKVIAARLMPGTLSQDWVTVFAAAVLLFLTIVIKETDYKKQIMVLAIIGYLFYGYGIWVIERIYNAFYLVYMAIFGLSFYSLVFGIAAIRPEVLKKVQLSNPMRLTALGFLLFIPLLFGILWTSQLIPLMVHGRKIEFMYSIYILDLCFVMPAFVIVAFLTARKKSMGLTLAPAVFLKGFSVLFSVGLGEFFKPAYHQIPDWGGLGFYCGLAAVFLGLAVIYLRKLKLSL